MEKLVIELTNQKAYRLLKELEGLNLIKMVQPRAMQLSSLRQKVRQPISEAQIENKLEQLRKEWSRDT